MHVKIKIIYRIVKPRKKQVNISKETMWKHFVKFQDFSRTFDKYKENSRTFKDFPGHFSNFSTFQDLWEPCCR